MRRALLRVLLPGLAGIASCALAQTASDADAWGEPVDGVQLRVALAPSGPPALPGALPAMELQIRNRGRITITVRPEELMYAHVEVDGHWYAQTYAVFGSARPVDIAPGSQSSMYRREPGANAIVMSGIGDDQGRRFELPPGQHQIRVGLGQGAFVNVLKTGNWLQLASNRITVDVPAWSASAERAALIARTSAGGYDYLGDARRLVEKYPDAALPAIEAGVSAAPDPDARADYVDLAGTIPGDGVIPFLLAQIAPTIELRSRLSAAGALLARGRNEGLWSLMETWQYADHNRAQFPVQAQLLEFLVHSGNPETLDLLGRLAETTADIRLAIVELLLPSDFRVLSGSRDSAFSTGVSVFNKPELPGGFAGAAAAERFLGGALDDVASVPIHMTYEGVTYAHPRVCDMAAVVLSQRWPEKYRFTWSTDAADRDRQIAVIRAAWKKTP